jgi:hypothetical protein
MAWNRLVVAGCCCFAAAGGGYYFLKPTPPPTPPYTPQPVVVTVPAPSQRVASSPVLGRPTDFDARNTSAQLPAFSNDHELDGPDALRYINDLRRIIPGTNWYFTVLDQVTGCLQQQGVIAARAYVGTNDRQLPISATVVVVVSGGQLQSLEQVALNCALKKLHLSAGGPTEGFRPCADAYYYDVESAGRYFVFAASTTRAYCTAVREWHASRHAITDIWSIEA